MRALILGLGFIAALQYGALASDQNAMVGAWRLVSNKVTIDNEQPVGVSG